MPNDRSPNRNALVGALLIAGAITAALVIFFIGDVVRRLEPSLELVALLDYAGALDKNSEVWIAGRPVGAVTAVALRPASADSTERVAVHLRIPRKFGEQVPRDSRVRITSARVIGSPVVDILPGTPGSPLVEDGDTLRPRPTGTIEGLLNRAITLTAGFDTMFRTMSALEAPALRSGAQVERVNRQFQAVSRDMRELFGALQQGPLQTLGDPRMQAALDRVQHRVAELRQAFGQAAERARAAQSDAQPSLERLRARADTIGGQLTQLRNAATAGGGGLLLRAQKDSAIVKAIHDAQVQLDSLMVETMRNPLRFWF